MKINPIKFGKRATVVRQLQAAGHVTRMTGDGVNDAAALRQLEVDIAVNTATAVARKPVDVIPHIVTL